jgi:hypothetical protein
MCAGATVAPGSPDTSQRLYKHGVAVLHHDSYTTRFCAAAQGCFENTVQALYKYVIPKPKAQCSKVEQTGVSFLAGYIAGVWHVRRCCRCRSLAASPGGGCSRA